MAIKHNPNPSPNPQPSPTPNPNQKKMYMNFGRQKTRQQNLKTKFLNMKKDIKTREELKLLTISVSSVVEI
jgi:hypothetical protein